MTDSKILIFFWSVGIIPLRMVEIAFRDTKHGNFKASYQINALEFRIKKPSRSNQLGFYLLRRDQD